GYLKPESVIMLKARSKNLTGFPISNTKISGPNPMAAAANTNCYASGMLMKYLIIYLCVTVKGLPFSICFLNKGITQPLEPKTLPNLVIINLVLPAETVFWQHTIISAIRLVAPITFVELTALSVEIKINLST